jgi:hypothetical protein
MLNTLAILLVTALTFLQPVSALLSIARPVLNESLADPSNIKVSNMSYVFSSQHLQWPLDHQCPHRIPQHFQSGWSVLEGHAALPDTGNWTLKPNSHIWVPGVNQLGSPLNHNYCFLSLVVYVRT